MDGFELAVRAIVGQQVSVAGARTVLGRLVREHGGLSRPPMSWRRPIPAASRSRARGERLSWRSRDWSRPASFGSSPDADADEARARLLAIPGIGPWTASYIAMRALGDRDVFLPGDVGVRRGARRASEAIPIRTAGAPGAPTRSCISGTPEIRSRAMRAVQITDLTGPESALQEVDLPEPEPSHPLTPGSGVVIDVHAAGVSFPEVLQTRGEYQIKPDLPFVPGSEVAGVVRSAPEGSGLARATAWRAAACSARWAEVAVAPDFLTFELSDELDFAQGAGLILNYHTAYFSLKHRGRLAEGETVLVHGAAGGIGTATLQVAKGLGARTIAVVSSDDKERIAREAGADEVVRSDGAVEGRGEGAVGRRRGHRDRPRGRRPLHRQPPVTPRERPARGGGLHRRLDPRGEGQPAAPEQPRGRRAPAGARS